MVVFELCKKWYHCAYYLFHLICVSEFIHVLSIYVVHSLHIILNCVSTPYLFTLLTMDIWIHAYFKYITCTTSCSESFIAYLCNILSLSSYSLNYNMFAMLSYDVFHLSRGY